jgi:putative transposase
MTLVDQHASTVGVTDACHTLGVARATWYRRRARRHDATARSRSRAHPRRLSDAERARVLEVLCSEEFLDRAPREIYAILLERGQYLCSVRTMYRILAEQKAVRERRPQRNHPENTVPRCCAKARNQLWSWDITKLAGPHRTWFNLYVVLDVFSRYVVTWLIARRESSSLATRLIEHALIAEGIDKDQLTIHADRGAPMTSKSLAQLLAGLGVERSHSRPRVSNDNPFSEAQFKTLKYCPDYPGRFADIASAREWATSFFDWYNHDHRHEGIGLFTPADVHFGRHRELGRVRQRTLDAAFASHPERFVRGRPTSPAVPPEVWINRPADTTITPTPSAPSSAMPFRGEAGELEGRPAPAPQQRQSDILLPSDLALTS